MSRENQAELMAASSRLNQMDSGTPIGSVYGYAGSSISDMAACWDNDRIRTSEAFIYYFDAATLTEELLVQEGGTQERPGVYRFGRLEVMTEGLTAASWVWSVVWRDDPNSESVISPQYQPLTLGQLRQLLVLLESR